MQLQFVAPGLARRWPDLDALSAADVDRHAPRFRGGINDWIVQTYLLLKDSLAERGLHATIGETFARNAVNLAHRDSLNRLFVPYHRSYIVGVRADRPPLHLCRWQIVQNDLGSARPRTRYLPMWPQPGLIERDPARGARIESIVYFGRAGAAPAWFYDPRFHDALARLGVTFRVSEAQWFDYSNVDLVLAYRTEAVTLLRHKPASKLVNAWRAGTPALLADEPAYASLRRSPLDYVSIASPADVLAAVRDLRASPTRYQAMVANGLRRASEFSRDANRARWLEFLTADVLPDATRWTSERSALVDGWGAQVAALARQKLATKRFKRRVRVELRTQAAAVQSHG
jgi:hypothetical protein